MENTLYKFLITNRKLSGMTLLTPPPGTGKTYASTRFICHYALGIDRFSNIKNNRKIFYTTSNLNNVPRKPLKERYAEAGYKDRYDKDVLVLESNTDAVRRFFRSDKLLGYEDQGEDGCVIDKTIQQSEAYQNLRNYIRGDSDVRGEGKLDDQKLAELRRYDHEFRDYIKGLLWHKYPELSEREQAVKYGRYRWLGIMYPSVWVRDESKKIVFMSVAKMLLPIDPIYTKAFRLYNDDIIKGSFFFVDEIDSTKDTVLDRIIEDGEQNRMDLIKFFSDIYEPFARGGFPAEFYQESLHNMEARAGKAGEENTPLARLNRISEDMGEFNTMHRLDFNLKTEGEPEDESYRYIFHGRVFYTIKDYDPWVDWDEEKKTNVIHYTPMPEGAGNDLKLRYLLGGIKGKINYYCSFLMYMADNYWHLMTDEDEPGRSGNLTKDTFHREDAVSSCLNNFPGIDSDEKEKMYITSRMNITLNADDFASDFDDSFYSTGFSVYALEDSISRNMRTNIVFKSFEITPEQILLTIARKAKVVGISATANLTTVLGNYDMEYIRHTLGPRFCETSDEDKAEIAAEFRESIKHYDKTSIHVDAVPAQDLGQYSVKWWERIVGSGIVARTLKTKVDNEVMKIKDKSIRSGDTDDGTVDGTEDETEDINRAWKSIGVSRDSKDFRLFCKKRYYRIAAAYSLFKKMHLHSFMCLLNKYPRENDHTLNEVTLREIFSEIDKCYDPGSPSCYGILESKGYDQKMEEIKSALSSGQKQFIISTYQAASTGQNPQFLVPADMEKDVVKINDFNRKKAETDENGATKRPEMDIEGIFLDLPTNLVVNIRGKVDDMALDTFIFQMMEMNENGELTYSGCMNNIKEAFKKRHDASYKPGHLDKGTMQSMEYSVVKNIKQGVGRICRTNMKAKNIYILVSDEAMSQLAMCPMKKDELVNPEFKAIMDKAAEYRAAQAEDEDRYERLNILNSNHSEYSNRFLKRIMDSDYGWTQDNIRKWKKIRDFTLRHPTVSREEIGEEKMDSNGEMRDSIDEEGRDIVWNQYAVLPEKGDRIWFGEEDDYDTVTTSFMRTDKCPQEVSEENARLPELMELDGVREFFTRSGYATSFSPAEHILCPTLFTNVYKGALGEVIGRFLIEERIPDIRLEEIEDTDIYELFDFVHKASGVYFDFKHRREWQMDAKTAEANKAWIRQKMKECGCNAVFIINIITDNADQYLPLFSSSEIPNVYEIPYLYKAPGQPNTEAFSKIMEVVNRYEHESGNGQHTNGDGSGNEESGTEGSGTEGSGN